MRVACHGRVYRVKECRSRWSQMWGWMLRRLPGYDGLLFVFEDKRRVDVHTFFCVRSLDIFYLDRRRSVVAAYRKVRPFTWRVQGVPAWFILEVKAAPQIRVGNTISFLR